jgi:hypothetical protein
LILGLVIHFKFFLLEVTSFLLSSMANLNDAIFFYSDRLLAWQRDQFPDADPAFLDAQSLRSVADHYGTEKLLKEYEDEIKSYHDVIEEDENQIGGARNEDEYWDAVMADMETEDGRDFGATPLEKWRHIDDLFQLTKQSERKIKKFNSTEYRYEVEISRLPCLLNPEDSIAVLPRILEKVFELCTAGFDADDRLVIGLECQNLDPGIYLSMRKLSDFNVEALMQKIALLNSQNKLCVDGSFRIRVFRTVMPRGGGKRKHIHVDRDRKRFAHALVTVKVDGNLCLPAALLLGKFRLTHDIGVGQDSQKQWKKLIHPTRTRTLTREAKQISKDCNLPVGQMLSLDHLEVLQKTSFPDFQVGVRRIILFAF